MYPSNGHYIRRSPSRHDNDNSSCCRGGGGSSNRSNKTTPHRRIQQQPHHHQSMSNLLSELHCDSSGIPAAATEAPSPPEVSCHAEFVLNARPLNTNSSANSPAVQQPLPQQRPVAVAPCLSCLMCGLQSSGLLNSCWSAAFAELDEAFTIKRVADAMTNEGGSGAKTSSRHQHQHQQAENAKMHCGRRHAQPPLVQHAAQTSAEPTKWHALEALCGLLNDISACQHRV